MLELRSITKTYVTGDFTQTALKEVSLSFRKNEFVAVLGASGSGKTTLLNIVGGLDHYDSGDLMINGRSTKEYRDRDWDTYRNHSIGFIFQNYGLIPHQSVLANVELALTLSGVSKTERRRRAEEALRQVGLGEHMKKKPNQMSGGQMQRVAIARALINDPDILLADEPTGALDSDTSVQIMELLRKVAQDRLIIMVTHNPELAAQYATRTVRLRDGQVVDDTAPYTPTAQENETAKQESQSVKKGRRSMSLGTAVSLSLNNLMTKKGRTCMTAFAGSIGIIGIALILSISNGVERYIQRVEEDTLSSYPISIQQESVDMSSLMSNMMGAREGEEHPLDKVYSADMMGQMMSTMSQEVTTNNLADFKAYLESGKTDIDGLTNDIQYGYGVTLNVYRADVSDGVVQVNPATIMEKMGFSAGNPMMAAYSSADVWSELIGNQALLASQYDVLAGAWPQRDNEVVLIVNENNEVSDYTLYALGLKDQSELEQMFRDVTAGKTVAATPVSFSYDEILSTTFRLVDNTAYYEKQADESWLDRRADADYVKTLVEAGQELKIVGVLRPNEQAIASSAGQNGGIGYTHGLVEGLIGRIQDSDIARQQQDNPEIDVFTGLPFVKDGETIQTVNDFDLSALPAQQQAYLSSLSEEERQQVIAAYAHPSASSATLEQNLRTLGVADLDNPTSINLYPVSFADKDAICDIIADYNQQMKDGGQEEDAIQYTDYVGLLMSSVTTIVNVVSYVLIAFVAISLVVSSIMIGIITYISVLERTREIGILRAIGASKKDISRVFNAETLIVGFAAGIIGIGITLLLLIPTNLVIANLADLSNLAALPVAGGVILVGISVALTLIAGLIPSRVAAKKDPVVALRTE